MANQPRTMTLDQEDVSMEAFNPNFGGNSNLPAVLPSGSDTAINIFGGVITAQKVAVKRNLNDVMQRMKALSARAGMRYVYRIPFKSKNKNTGEVTTQFVEGPTIVMANDMAREFGNCGVETRVIDAGTHWMFYARFTDYESGYQLVRPYQQRKGQNTGMKDVDRAADMVFQIGTSKAIRNVVVNALQTLTDFCVDEAKAGTLARIEKDPAKSKAWIITHLERLAVDPKRVQLRYGRSAEHWTNEDMAQIYMELRGILEGVATADDVYPIPGQDDDDAKDKAETKTENKPIPPTETTAKPETTAGQTNAAMTGAAAGSPAPAGQVVGGNTENVAQETGAKAQTKQATKEPAPKPADTPAPKAVTQADKTMDSANALFGDE